MPAAAGTVSEAKQNPRNICGVVSAAEIPEGFVQGGALLITLGFSNYSASALTAAILAPLLGQRLLTKIRARDPLPGRHKAPFLLAVVDIGFTALALLLTGALHGTHAGIDARQRAQSWIPDRTRGRHDGGSGINRLDRMHVDPRSSRVTLSFLSIAWSCRLLSLHDPNGPMIDSGV